MEKKHSIIKKIKNGLKITAIGLLAAASITGATTLSQVHDIKSLASTEQIEASAESLGIDTSYILSSNRHIQHNGKEPIYVTIDGSIPDYMREYIVESLDHIFGLASQFNEKYRYEIVDSLSYIKKITKASINFTIYDFPTEEEFTKLGDSGAPTDIFAYTVHETSNKYNRIRLSPRLLKGGDHDKYQTVRALINHELLHVFGAADLYNREDEFIINSSMYNALYGSDMIAPKDQRVLAYMCQDKFDTQEEKDNYAKRCQSIFKNYEELYYQSVIKSRGGDINSPILRNMDNINSNFDIGPVKYGKVSSDGKFYMVNEDINAHKYISIAINDNKYKLKLSIEYEDKILNAYCTGEIYKIGDTIVLKEVNLPHITKYGKENVLDLYVQYGENGLNSEYVTIYTTDDTIRSVINMDYNQELNI